MRPGLAGLSFLIVLTMSRVLPSGAATTNGEPSVAQLIAQARASNDRGDLEGERTALQQVLALAPSHRQARLALTDVLMRLGQWGEAESQAHVLLTQFPTDTEPAFLLSAIALRTGDPQKAKEMATRCMERGDTRPEVYKVLALSEYLLGDSRQFETNIRAVLDKNPQDVEARYFFARYLFEEKRYVESRDYFERVIKLQSDNYKAHYYLGLLNAAAGDSDQARAEFEESVKIVEIRKISYAWPFAEIGRALSDAGETQQALEWLARGINNDPTSPKIYYEYACALFQMGPTARVKEAALKAIRLDPGYAEAYYLLARYYRKSGENQSATQILAKFRELKSHPVPSPYGLPRRQR